MRALSVMNEFGATMLERVESAQIFEVHWDGVEGAFVMTEACDHYHSTLLTPEQLLALADEMRAMAKEKVNEKTTQ